MLRIPITTTDWGRTSSQNATAAYTDAKIKGNICNIFGDTTADCTGAVDSNGFPDFITAASGTRLPITPDDCAEAICWLAGERSGRTTGHVVPVDGGLVEAFLR